LIEQVAPRVLGRADRKGDALAAAVRGLSEVYTRRREALGLASEAHAARLRFFLPRDLLKVTGPLAELGAELPRGPTWRVLDVGAGLGTSTLGVAAFAQTHGVETLHVTALEQDAGALDVFATLAKAAQAAGLVPAIELQPRRVDLTETEIGRLPKVDLIVVGLALNELFIDLDEAERLDAAESFLRSLLRRLDDGGTLIVIEPALRATSRSLQELRNRLGPHVFAPCLREGACPLMRRKRDWCHAALPIELPKALGQTAKAAGLRTGRLTFSYLTLRNDGARLAGHGDPRALRIVGGPVVSKGKTEWDGCGEAGLVHLRQLDRERSDVNGALDGALRGTRVRMSDAPADGSAVRIRPDVAIARI